MLEFQRVLSVNICRNLTFLRNNNESIREFACKKSFPTLKSDSIPVVNNTLTTFSFRNGFSGLRSLLVRIQTIRFGGIDYFEIHDTCVNEVGNIVPDFGDLRHDWRTCSPSDIICGLCKVCRYRPLPQKCKFQRVSDLVDCTYKRCCAHFKVYLFKAAVIGSFHIKGSGKIVCPLHETNPKICETPLGERETILAHIYRNHFNHLKQPDFYCLSLVDVSHVVILEREAFLYYKRVEQGNLIVGMARVGFSSEVFSFTVSFWSLSEKSQNIVKESYSFAVPFLHECMSNVTYMKVLFNKSLHELSEFINRDRNEIRMSVAVKVRP